MTLIHWQVLIENRMMVIVEMHPQEQLAYFIAVAKLGQRAGHNGRFYGKNFVKRTESQRLLLPVLSNQLLRLETNRSTKIDFPTFIRFWETAHLPLP